MRGRSKRHGKRSEREERERKEQEADGEELEIGAGLRAAVPQEDETASSSSDDEEDESELFSQSGGRAPGPPRARSSTRSTPTPRTRQHTLELPQTVNERMVHEHRALSRALSNAEAAEQEAGALDAELMRVNDELARLGAEAAYSCGTNKPSMLGGTPLPRTCSGSIATLTPTSSRSPAGRRWRKAEQLVSTR